MPAVIHRGDELLVAYEWREGATHPRVVEGIEVDGLFVCHPKTQAPAGAIGRAVPVIQIGDQWHRVDAGDWIVERSCGAVELMSCEHFRLSIGEPDRYRQRARP